MTAPRLLALTDDLFLLPRFEDAAAALGFACERADMQQLAAEAIDRPVPLTEPLEGADADLVRALVTDPPALILVDLASSAIPWRRWIQMLKTSSATRRVPIVAFGPHVGEAELDEARRLGADRVVTRGQLQARLAEILRAEAKPPDATAIAAGCGEALAAEARRGLEMLEAGAYLEAHEHFERAVLDRPGPEGTVYRCLLHLAVAHLHTQRGNWRGAQKMLLRMRPWLASLPAACRGLDVAALRTELDRLQAALDEWRGGAGQPRPLRPPKVPFTEVPPARPSE